MHHMFQDYYNQDPQNRISHIPSVVINPPVSSQTLSNLCYSSRYLNETVEVAEADIRATAVALLVAAQQLEADSDAAQIQEANQEADSTQPVRKYFLKRNYSGMPVCGVGWHDWNAFYVSLCTKPHPEVSIASRRCNALSAALCDPSHPLLL